jgi:hypothetical protein
LGFTLVADGVFQAFKPAAFLIDALAIGFFVAMGLMGLRGYRWAFLVGGIFYALDALIYLSFEAYLPLAFHAWALFFIWVGGMALHRAIKASEAAAALPPAPPPVPPLPPVISP